VIQRGRGLGTATLATRPLTPRAGSLMVRFDAPVGEVDSLAGHGHRAWWDVRAEIATTQPRRFDGVTAPIAVTPDGVFLWTASESLSGVGRSLTVSAKRLLSPHWAVS
jgi:hypothetical protein